MPQAPALIEPSVKALEEAIEALEGAVRDLEQALEACAFDPFELERCEERLFALRAMGRKHGVPIESLPSLAQEYADDLAVARRRTRGDRKAGGRSRRVARRVPRGRQRADRRARSAAPGPSNGRSWPNCRRSNSSGPHSASICANDRTLVSASGYDRAEFIVRTNPGSRPGPLMKVASGGELSRFLLAIKVCLAERGTAPTLVFDEIDAGVGGAVADAVGQRLFRLSARAQVLTVTHAPQVAARAQSHYRIAKSVAGKGDRVVTSVSRLGAGERREEIARMLAGAEVTREARAAAVSLIEKAG